MKLWSSTRLFRAIKNNKVLELSQVIKDKQIDVDMDLADGNTALTLAISKGKSSIVNLLLKNGANPNKEPKKGRHPMLRAIEETAFVLSPMVKAGGDINATGAGGDYNCFDLVVALRKEDNFFILLKSKMKPIFNVKLLEVAMKAKSMKIVKELLRRNFVGDLTFKEAMKVETTTNITKMVSEYFNKKKLGRFARLMRD